MLRQADLVILQRDTGIDPLDDSQINLKSSTDGTTYILTHDGRLYREDARSRKWYYEDTVYQPEEMARAYVQWQQAIQTMGRRYPSIRQAVLERHRPRGCTAFETIIAFIS